MSRSGSYTCTPVSGACKASRKYPGQAILVYKPCCYCGEKRCRNHCKCARDENLQGQERGRGRDDSSSSASRARPPVRVQSPVLPVQEIRQTTSVKVFPTASGEQWLDACISEIEKSREVSIFMYMYDQPQLHHCLLRCIKPRGGLKLQIVIDSSRLKEDVPYFQKARLSALQSHGAKIFESRGVERRGIMHLKVVLLDNANICYTGSSNATKAAEANYEVMMRMTGPCVKEIKRICQAVKDGAKPASLS